MKNRALHYYTCTLSIFFLSAIGAILIAGDTDSRNGKPNSETAQRYHTISDSEESAPVTLEYLVEKYLSFREESWPLVVPASEGELFGSWDSIIANVGRSIVMGWFWYFNDGEIRLAKGELPDLKDPKPFEVVIFEDIYASRVIVFGMAEGKKPIKLYSQKVLPILDVIENEDDVEAEICMRRMAIRLTAVPFNYVAPKQEIQLFDLAVSKSFAPLRMMSGEYPSDKIWMEISKHAELPNHYAGLTIHAPTSSVARLDVFSNSDLLDHATWSLLVDAQSLNENGVLAFTNTIINFSRRYFLAANADAHSDNDGLSDGRERFLYFTSPYDEDTDGDNLPDNWEIQYGLDPLDDGSIDPENGPDGDPDEDGFSNQLEFELGAPANNPAWNGAELVYSLQRVHEVTNGAKATSYTSLHVDIEDSENCGGPNASQQDVSDIFQISSLLDCGYFIELIVTGDVEQNRSMYDHVFAQAYEELFYFGGLQNYETDCGLVMVNQTATNIHLVLPSSQVILRYDTVSYKYHKDAYAQVIGVRTTGVLKIEMPTNGLNVCFASTSAGFEMGTGGYKPDDITWQLTPSITGMGTSVSFNPNSLTSGEYIVSAESAEFPCVNTSCVIRIVEVDSLSPDNFEQEIDDQDGNHDTRTFVVNMTTNADDIVTVTALSNPNLPEFYLPDCWSLDVIEGSASGSGKLTRTIDRTQPSKTVIRVSCCGGNEKYATIYVVRCSFTGFSDNEGFVGHAWWHLEIEPDSAINGALQCISNSFTWQVDRDGGFFPVHSGDPHDDGFVSLGNQGHTATSQFEWIIPFADLVSGLTDLGEWLRTPGTYDFDTRNCVWGTIRIGNASGVTMPTFDYQPPPVPPYFGFWHPYHMHDWLNAQP